MMGRFMRHALLAGAAWAFLSGAAFAADVKPTLETETPAHFTVKTDSYDYVRREVMIPMRDGVKLFTVILIPKGAHEAPILLTRTPYSAGGRTGHASEHLAEVLGGNDVAEELILEEGYIRVLQDVRGKYGSEGDYVMNRPLQGPLNPTQTDHSTDTYDTIDWLVKNLPESNGKVGIYGISYDGFTALMALVNPHPALRAAIPINSMVDGWRGDDWFHNGAFRTQSITYAHDQQASRGGAFHWWSSDFDEYEEWLKGGSVADIVKAHGAEQIGFIQKLMAHPAYDSFWQEQALDKILTRQKLTVPTMLVHSLWDQEDIYGNMAVYQAMRAADPNNPNLYLVMGPWYHHQQRQDGSALGNLKWGSDTARTFRHTMLRPFFAHYLKDEKIPLPISPVTAFESGSNEWRSLPAWPMGCASGCAITPKPIYLQNGAKLGFDAPPAHKPDYTDYVADPAKPVPFLPRPVNLSGKGESNWSTWLTSDQRDVASRTDVLSYVSQPLTAPMKIAGAPKVTLNAATSGSDGDFVVKLIDVYPGETGRDPGMGGYQFMVAADIFRGRYRDDLSAPKAIPANQMQSYRFALPTANHVFLPGHRIMVQIQSSWFPLYDRNPQTYVENIFFAKPADYQKATIKVFDAGANASFVELPVVSGK